MRLTQKKTRPFAKPQGDTVDSTASVRIITLRRCPPSHKTPIAHIIDRLEMLDGFGIVARHDDGLAVFFGEPKKHLKTSRDEERGYAICKRLDSYRIQ